VDFWCNEFGMRARIALREKRVPFEFVEEDLRVRQRSDLVRRMNPVHRSIPILIHAGRPVCGSMNIVEYVDEARSQSVGEFRKTRHPRNVKFDKVLDICFSGAGNSRFSEA
jgi:glutathione S-transferase